MSFPAIRLKPAHLLLIALLLVNLALLVVRWASAGRGPETPIPEGSGAAGVSAPAEAPNSASGADPVWLLSERKSTPPHPGNGARSSAAPQPAAALDPRSPAEESAEPAVAAAEMERPATATAGSASLAAKDLPTSGPTYGPAAGAAAGAATATASGPAKDLAGSAAGSPNTGGAAGLRACRLWGPFTDDAEVQALIERLGLTEGDFRVDRADNAGATDYLVYIAHGGNRDAARRLLQELRSQGVEGYIMTGRFNNALSVGVFSSEARALKQQASVAAMGYAADIEALARTQQVYHLLAWVEPGSVDLGGQNRPCSDIAQAP